MGKGKMLVKGHKVSLRHKEEHLPYSMTTIVNNNVLSISKLLKQIFNLKEVIDILINKIKSFRMYTCIIILN
jgi:hypothetical protein